MSEQPNEYLQRRDVEFFLQFVRNDRNIERVEFYDNSWPICKLYRAFGDIVIVYLTAPYTLGIADYLDIRSRYQDINCIVVCSHYSGYTREAKERAVHDKVGVFMFNEFIGAIHEENFWSYAVSNDRGELSE